MSTNVKTIVGTPEYPNKLDKKVNDALKEIEQNGKVISLTTHVVSEMVSVGGGELYHKAEGDVHIIYSIVYQNKEKGEEL